MADGGGQFNFRNFGNGPGLGAHHYNPHYYHPPTPPLESHCSLSYSYSSPYPYMYFPPPCTYTHTSFKGPYGYPPPPPYGQPAPPKSYEHPPYGAYPPVDVGGHHGGNPALGHPHPDQAAKMDKGLSGGGGAATGAAARSAAPAGEACYPPPKGEGATAEAAVSCQVAAMAK